MGKMNAKAKEKRKKLMLEGDIRTLIPMMAVPTIVAQLITTIYNLVDTYFVSTLGTNATAAVGINSSLQRMITLIGSLIGAGACSYIARLLGAKKEDDSNRVLSTCLMTGFGMGILFAIIGLMNITSLVNMLGATSECRVYSIQYASYVLFAAPVMIGSFILNMCMRSEGSATYAMVGIGTGGILNCFLDPLFIYGLNLGVAGASMATSISQLISFCILMYPYIKKTTMVRFSVHFFKYVQEDIREVLAIGSTSFFRSMFGVLAAVLINRVAGTFSTSALAAISVANRVMDFPFAIILGYGQGYQPVVGFNWGARQFKRVRESLKVATITSVVGAILIGSVIYLLSSPIIHVFNNAADKEVLRIGVLCIKLQCIVLVSHALNSIINMFYAGIGRAKNALFMSTARQGYCLWPMLLLLPRFWGVNGVAAIQAGADVLALAIAIPLGISAFRFVNKKEEDEEEESNGHQSAALYVSR